MSLRRHITCTLAAVLMALLATTAGIADVEISEEAKKQFSIGVALLKDPAGARFEEAYAAFKAAYAASPSPKILGNLAFCAMNLERDGEAIEAYERYLKEAGALDAEERAQIESDLVVLRGGVVQVTLVVDPTESTVIDTRNTATGRSVVNRYTPQGGVLQIGIRAGQHVIQVEHPGFETAEWEFDAVRGEPLEKSIELQETPAEPGAPAAQPASQTSAPSTSTGAPPADGPPDEVERPIPATVWVSLAATGAFGIAFAVLGGLSLGNKGEFDDAYDAGDLVTAQDLRDTGTDLNIAADVMLGGTVLAAGLTLVFYLTRPEEPAEGAPTAVSVDPMAGPGVGGVIVSGAF